MSSRKDDESPFRKCTSPQSATKVEHKFEKASWHVLKENGVLSFHKANPSKLTKAPLPSFIASFKGLVQEESDLLKMRTSNVFDPNAYKLMKRSGYDYSKPTSLEHVIDSKPYRLNNTQKVVQ